MRFRVKSTEDAAAATSYFNRFHDGFLESLMVKVVPEDPEGFGFGLPVRYEATLSFVHSNYAAARDRGARPQRIEMRLSGITRLNVGDIVPLDDMLQSCLLKVGANGAIHLDVGGDGLVTFDCEALTIEEMGDAGVSGRGI